VRTGWQGSAPDMRPGSKPSRYRRMRREPAGSVRPSPEPLAIYFHIDEIDGALNEVGHRHFSARVRRRCRRMPVTLSGPGAVVGGVSPRGQSV
jgi:hypothetical protein